VDAGSASIADDLISRALAADGAGCPEHAHVGPPLSDGYRVTGGCNSSPETDVTPINQRLDRLQV
jgi:hypothetical protein